jgi:hypothetical protein
MYGSRPISAFSAREAQDKNTATKQFSTRPAVRNTGVQRQHRPWPSYVAGLADHQDRIGDAQALDHITAYVIADRIGIPPRSG